MTILENSRVPSCARPRHSLTLAYFLALLNTPLKEQNTWTNTWVIILRPRYSETQKTHSRTKRLTRTYVEKHTVTLRAEAVYIFHTRATHVTTQLLPLHSQSAAREHHHAAQEKQKHEKTSVRPPLATIKTSIYKTPPPSRIQQGQQGPSRMGGRQSYSGRRSLMSQHQLSQHCLWRAVDLAGASVPYEGDVDSGV